MTANTASTAWQTALGAEYAAAYGYALLGPRLVDSGQIAMARTNGQTHGDLAASTSAQVAAAGLDPVAPQASYLPPHPVHAASDAQSYALYLEDQCASAWRAVVAATASVALRPTELIAATPAASGPGVGRLRLLAAAALTASAVRAVAWRVLVTPSSPTVAFPGI